VHLVREPKVADLADQRRAVTCPIAKSRSRSCDSVHRRSCGGRSLTAVETSAAPVGSVMRVSSVRMRVRVSSVVMRVSSVRMQVSSVVMRVSSVVMRVSSVVMRVSCVNATNW
jgi:hypothetical protein